MDLIHIQRANGLTTQSENWTPINGEAVMAEDARFAFHPRNKRMVL